MEPDVLPVFYFNDLLLTNVGDTIGLNLFEPRYLLMCNRMASDPRFLFMPNFEDYRCVPGDVGFVVKLTGLWNQARGSSYGVQGYAEQLVAVSCAWVEPDTNGLHYAQIFRLDDKKAPLHHTEAQALVSGLMQRGWTAERDQFSKAQVRRFSIGQSEVLCGRNWPDRAWILAFLAGDGQKHLRDAWTAGLPELAHPRFSGAAFLDQAVQCFPPVLHGWPLQEVLEDLRSSVSNDADAVLALKSMNRGDSEVPSRQTAPLLLASPPHMTKDMWTQLLSEARLARVCGMPALMPTVRMEVEVSSRRSSGSRAENAVRPTMPKAVILLANGSNVELRALPKDVEVTPESARTCVQALHWKLNRLRLAIVKRARSKGQRPLAMLEDDVARQICEFVACQPQRVATEAQLAHPVGAS